jgi:hypothetical protein
VSEELSRGDVIAVELCKFVQVTLDGEEPDRFLNRDGRKGSDGVAVVVVGGGKRNRRKRRRRIEG